MSVTSSMPGRRISAGALGAGNMENREDVTASEEQIAATLEGWDVAASGQRLFVARIEHGQSAGGIVLTDNNKDEQNDGVVISAGPLAYINDQHPEDGRDADARLAMTPDELDSATRRFLQPGDRITFGQWSGNTVNRRNTVKKGLKKLMVMNADDVVGVPRTGDDK